MVSPLHLPWLTALASLAVAGTARASEDPALARANRVLESTILVDGHNDLPIAIRNDRTAPGDLAAYDLRQRTRGHTD